MNVKLKKTINTSIQGIWLIAILFAIAAIYGIFTAENFLNYIENYGATYIYIAGLVTGLIMYKKGKYDFGAEIIQWVGLGCIIITFINAIMRIVIVGSFGVKGMIALLAIVLSAILIVEALKVIRLAGDYKHSNILMLIAICIIIIILACNIISARKLKIAVEKEKREHNQQEIINSKEENDETKLTPHEKYKEAKWGKDEIKTSTGETFKLLGDSIYYLDGKGGSTVISVTGTPIKLINSDGVIYILTEEGNVYYLDSKNSKFKFADVSKYKVVDIAHLNNNTNETVYFLTKDGILIDKNGVSYDKYNFVSKQSLTIGDLTVDVSFDKDGYIYYYNGLINSYEFMVNKDDDERITAQKMYMFTNEVLIVTKDNKLFSYDGKSNKVSYIKENVKQVMKQGTKLIELIVTFEDKTIEIYDNVKSGYNVKTNLPIDVKTIESFDAYTHHKDEIWSGVKTNKANIKNNKLYIAGKEITSEIPGTLKSVEELEIEGATVLSVLTEEGKAWVVALDDVGEYSIYTKYDVLINYKLMDMTIKKTQNNEEKFYYLTSEGYLLDEKGNQYSASY